MTVVVILGCSSSTPPPKPQVIPPVVSQVPVKVTWSIKLHANKEAGSFVPVVNDHVIFTADSKGYIYRIDPSDGTVISKFNLDRELSSGTAVNADAIFVTTADGYLLSVSRATGAILWQIQLPTISIASPQVSGDIVLVRTNDAELLAYNAITGTLIWVYQGNTPQFMVRDYDTFQAIDRQVVLIGEPGGGLTLVNLNTGVVIWSSDIVPPSGDTALAKLTDVDTRPVLQDKEICLATFNGKIVCLDAITSSVLWSHPFSTSYSVLIDIANVYAVSDDGVVYAFNKTTGALLWKNDILQYRTVSTPAFIGSNLLIADNEGYINIIRCGDGKLLARIKSDLFGSVAYPWTNGKKVILQAANGVITAINYFRY